MDVTEENMTPNEMLEKIAELDHSQHQLRDLNAEMRQWLDVADDEMAVLRSENAALRKHVRALEQIISDVQQIDVEPCSSPLAGDPDVKGCHEKKIQKLEKESTMIKEQNKKLTSEVRILQEQREQDKISLSKCCVALNSLEVGLGEAQMGLQDKEEAIQQKNLQLKQAEETVEEYSDIIKDLRRTNQELRSQLEDRQDEASLAVLAEKLGDQGGPRVPALSFAEEMKLLSSSDGTGSLTSAPAEPRHDQTEAGERLEPSVNLQASRGAGPVKNAVHKVGKVLLWFFTLAVLACVASGLCAGNWGVFSFDSLWSSARLLLQPYCRVHHGSLPPI